MREDCPPRWSCGLPQQPLSILVAIFSTCWPYNSSVYLCVSRRSSVETVGRSELCLEANSTSRTRKFVVSLKISVYFCLKLDSDNFATAHRSSPCHRFLSVYVRCPFFVAHFSGCHFFCSLKYRCHSFRRIRTITLCCSFFPTGLFFVAEFSGCPIFRYPFFRLPFFCCPFFRYRYF